MIGALYTLLFVGAEAPQEQPRRGGPGWRGERLRPRRERWAEVLRRLKEGDPPEIVPVVIETKPVERLPLPSGRISPEVTAYLDSLQARIAQAAREQEIARRALAAAQAEAELEAARVELAAAIEAERIARQTVRDIDIAFVASVLAEL